LKEAVFVYHCYLQIRLFGRYFYGAFT